jgi:hypothetical protein
MYAISFHTAKKAALMAPPNIQSLGSYPTENTDPDLNRVSAYLQSY